MLEGMEGTRDLMKALAEGIDEALNGDARERTNGFILLTFPMNSTGELSQVNHITNIQREDMVVMLTELLARLKGQPAMVGHA